MARPPAVDLPAPTVGVNEHALRKAFDASVAASPEAAAVDAALIQTGRTIADRVDEAVAFGEGQEVTKALYLLPHLINVLRELLATPASRHNVGEVAKPAKPASKLGLLRAEQATKRTG